jgi:hypothetical protein
MAAAESQRVRRRGRSSQTVAVVLLFCVRGKASSPSRIRRADEKRTLAKIVNVRSQTAQLVVVRILLSR